MKIAHSSDLAAEDMTKFMTRMMVNMYPFHRGTGSYSAREMWDPDQLRPFHRWLERSEERRNPFIAG